MMRFRLWIGMGLLLVGLVACSDRGARPVVDDPGYRPPTLVPTQVPQESGEQSTDLSAPDTDLNPTPTPLCTNSLWFLSDVSIPDGSVVQAGERLDKRWRVQNNGSCNWDERYHIKLIAGPGMGVPVQQALAPALSGTQVDIRMVFIAPEESGNYRSAWQAYDPQDQPFGDPFFIDIVVEATGDSNGWE